MAGRSRRRMLTVWWEHWPVVAAGLASGTPRDDPAVVLKANRVVACTPAATADGVAVGQRRRVAQQRCPGAVLLDDDPDRNAREFEVVLRTVGQFTPRLEMVEPGWLCVESRGPSRYFGGDEQLGRRIVAAIASAVGRHRDLSRLGVAIADGRFASAVASRLAAATPTQTIVVAAGASCAFLAPQPVAWLHETGEVDVELVSLFARLGLTTLEALAAMPRVDIADRFGPAGEHAHRLATGEDERPSRAVEPPRELRVERVFDDPVEQVQPLVFVGKQLADELTAELVRAGLICTRLIVSVETEHGERSERVWYRARGLSAAAIVERVRWQLDGWVAQGDLSAGVVLLRLDPDELRPDGGDQLRLWGGLSAADERAVRTVARLAGIAGEDAVLVPAWQGGRLPGDRYRWIPATTTDLTDADDTARQLRPRRKRTGHVSGGRTRGGSAVPDSRNQPSGRADGGFQRGEGFLPPFEPPWPGSMPAPSPAIVYADAVPAVVADEQGRVVTVGGRGELSAVPVTLAIGSGEPREITRWAGPWPLDERWWDERRHRRLARFQIVTVDGAAHLVAVERQQWHLLAMYA